MPRKRNSGKSSNKWLSYAERLKDPRWQLLKAKILLRDKGVCFECGRQDKTLHVHHKIYLRGKDPWEYDEDTLISLCMDCHDKREEAVLGLKMAIVDFTTEDFTDWTKRIKAERQRFESVRDRIQAAAPPASSPTFKPKSSDPTVWDQLDRPALRMSGKEFFKSLREAIG